MLLVKSFHLVGLMHTSFFHTEAQRVLDYSVLREVTNVKIPTVIHAAIQYTQQYTFLALKGMHLCLQAGVYRKTLSQALPIHM